MKNQKSLTPQSMRGADGLFPKVGAYLSTSGPNTSRVRENTELRLLMDKGFRTLLFLLFLPVIDTCCSQPLELPCECNTTVVWGALAALYSSTNGATWRHQGSWVRAGSTVCEWYGIETNCTSVDLSNNNLTGTLPPDISLLPKFRYFSVVRNNISGTLPSALSSWTSLRHLKISQNNFSGILSADFASWRHLYEFEIDGNHFSGALPPEYAAWSNITWFDASTNMLSGTLPPEYASWSVIRRFALHSNHMSGTLPPGYSAWKIVDSIVLSQNAIFGGIPSAYGALKPHTLVLSDNKLAGTVPVLNVTIVLAINNNPRLMGTIAGSMGFTWNVALCNTSLCGPLPRRWSTGLTKIICTTGQTTMEALLSGSPYALPTCSPTTALPRLVVSPDTHASPILAGPAGVVVATFAALIGSSGGPIVAMHMSLRTVALAVRLAQCNAANTASDTTVNTPVGTSIADNPTRLQVSSDSSLTAGTVVGNLVLLVALPLTLSAAGRFAAKKSNRVSVASKCGASGLLMVWSTLQIPTTAASVSLVVDVCCGAALVSGVVGGFGCATCAAALLLSLLCWMQVRTTRGQQLSRKRPRHLEICDIPKVLLRRRSRWVVPRAAPLLQSKPMQRVIGYLSRVRGALALQLLHSCHVPHHWVIVYDAIVGALAGVLIGVTSSPKLSCQSVQAGAWVLFGTACVQAAVAVLVRPRSTVADCAFDMVMCLWTGVCALLAAEEGTEGSVIAQSALAMLWATPLVALRIRRVYVTTCQSSSRREGSLDTLARGKPFCSQRLANNRAALCRGKGEHLLRATEAAQHEVLRVVIQQICRQRV